MAENLQPVGHPQAVVIAGPNGAGKTSAAPELLREAVGIDAFVNADMIAQGLAGFSPESVAFEAGRIMLKRLDELAQARANFAFESTLSGRSALRFLLGLKEVGYEVHIFYLWLPSPDVAVSRVYGRVQAGGHNVPEEAIRRRFWRGLVNFDRSYRVVATTWRLYDGSVAGERPMIARGSEDGSITVVDHGTWTRIRRRVEELA